MQTCKHTNTQTHTRKQTHKQANMRNKNSRSTVLCANIACANSPPLLLVVVVVVVAAAVVVVVAAAVYLATADWVKAFAGKGPSEKKGLMGKGLMVLLGPGAFQSTPSPRATRQRYS
jgi:hypothetical protein